MSAVPAAAREILDEGVLCYLAAPSPLGPHVTPVVFALEGDRVWGTTARRTVKARRWREDPAAGGLVRLEARSVTFQGRVTLYDALAPGTWGAGLRNGPQLVLASARFTVKNAGFFAGYARDAYRVPLGWTPPGRVVFSVDLEAGALLEGGRVVTRWGRWGGRLVRRARHLEGGGPILLGGLPDAVRGLLGASGEGTLAVTGPSGPVVLPARWARTEEVLTAALPRRLLALSPPRPGAPAALVVDHASGWRAARMAGALLRGDAEVLLPPEVRGGGDQPRGPGGAEEAAVRIVPRTAVWWRGWESGTVILR